MAVRKAFVLAAGFGKRLRPLTLSRPKPLLPVMGEPMLGRILDMLVSWGVEDIVVNAHHLAGQIEAFVREYVGDGDAKNTLKTGVSVEDAILGTGGALRKLEKWADGEPFWLVNGDIVVEDFDPEPVEEAFERSGRFAACWMSDSYGPRTVEADGEGRICNWRSCDAGFPGTYTYCGVALLSPEIFKWLPPERPAEGGNGKGFCSIVEAYERAMMEGGRFVTGVQEPDACWCDAGTLDSYKELNSEPMAPSLFGDRRLDAAVASLGLKDGETLAEYLGARGSDRMFYRLRGKGGEDVLAVVYENARKENANGRFAPITRFLAARGIRVPTLLADLPENCAYATEFVEGKSLEEIANGKGADILKLYAPVLTLLKSLREIPADAPDVPELEPGFGPELFAWERNLFLEECVRGRYSLDSIPGAAEKELEGIAETLSREPETLVHRDFQSSNILYSGDDRKNPFLIDYQGLRRGPAAYDAASLIYDPYAPIGKTDRALLAELAGIDGRIVAMAGVQRMCQALGAYCRLAAAGHSRFLKHARCALGNLHEAAHEAELPAMAEFSHALIERESMRAFK